MNKPREFPPANHDALAQAAQIVNVVGPEIQALEEARDTVDAHEAHMDSAVHAAQFVVEQAAADEVPEVREGEYIDSPEDQVKSHLDDPLVMLGAYTELLSGLTKRQPNGSTLLGRAVRARGEGIREAARNKRNDEFKNRAYLAAKKEQPRGRLGGLRGRERFLRDALNRPEDIIPRKHDDQTPEN